MTRYELDHMVLTVADIDATIAFYRDALGIEAETFAGGRRALRLSGAKINLHQSGAEFEPKAVAPTPGSGDLCLRSADPLERVAERLAAAGVTIEEGPVARTGALGEIRSIYLRDPDGNLIEISVPA
ncbi:MAG: VOC family protein [Pseudomonadota bacterium]